MNGSKQFHHWKNLNAAGGPMASKGGRGRGGDCLRYDCFIVNTVGLENQQQRERSVWEEKKIGKKFSATEVVGPVIWLSLRP